jgi:3-dehydroquinate synthase
MKTQKERFGIKPEGENMAQRLPVLYNKKPCYDIVFQQSFDGLWEELQELGASEKKLCIVTDSRVDELYGAQNS